MNGGERDELIAILRLIQIRQLNIPFDGLNITSIKSGYNECKDLPGDISLNEISLLNDQRLIALSASIGVGKSPGGAKADIQINGIGYSIKSNRSAPPALVNHTARPGFENVCSRVNSNISDLDTLISDYWEKRKKGTIAEDVKNSDVNSPFRNEIEFFRPILNYFLFTGTGQKDSKFPAQKIIKLTDPLNENTWDIYDASNALDLFWDKLIFSLRAKKGMPGGYPDKMTPKALLTKPSVDIWTEYINDNYRGALHIRASK